MPSAFADDTTSIDRDRDIKTAQVMLAAGDYAQAFAITPQPRTITIRWHNFRWRSSTRTVGGVLLTTTWPAIGLNEPHKTEFRQHNT